ncbi:hypothetical protein Tco_0196382 [Tanacetum coccineum]
MDLFGLICNPNPFNVKTVTRPRAAHEVPLLTATATCVIGMEDTTMTSGSPGTPSTIEKSPLDFDNENLTPSTTEGVGAGDQAQDGLAHEVPLVETATTTESTRGGKSLATTGLETGSTFTPVAQETSAGAKSVSDPDPLSYARPPPHFEQDVAQSSKGTATEIHPQYVATTEVNVQLSMGSPDSEKSTSVPSVDGSPGGIYQPGWGVTNNCRIDTPKACQDKVVMGSQLRLRFKQEVRLLKEARAKIARLDQRIQVRREEIKTLDEEIKSLRTVTGEEMIKAIFEEFKKYEDDKVEQRCAEMDARLDVLTIDFDEELYPHMLTAIAGCRWVIGHGLRLAVMKCAESTELRQVFADVVSDGIVNGMSKGLKHGVEHGEAKLDLVAIKAYDPEADAKYVAAIQALKDLKFPLVDQLEKLKEAPIDLIMASLNLEGDSGEDTPQWIREIRPSSSQLKIHVYPEVRGPKDPWSIKEEILLEDAIAANKRCVEKKKKCRVVCRTHGVGSAHHARSDGIPVLMPTVAPQGLAILLADAVTQTEISEDEASLRLLRSKSLPPMYNFDWP